MGIDCSCRPDATSSGGNAEVHGCDSVSETRSDMIALITQKLTRNTFEHHRLP